MLPNPYREGERKAGTGRTILVVDDDGIMRSLICRILRESGYTLLLAANAAQARRAEAVADRIDLLLTDIAIPGGLGPELEPVKKYRPGLKVLYMSHYPPEQLREHQLDLDGAPFLRKPFMPEQLLMAVQNAINRSALGPAPSPAQAR